MVPSRIHSLKDFYQKIANLVKDINIQCGPSMTTLYTANVLTIKTTGTGNCRGPAGKICTIYGKGL